MTACIGQFPTQLGLCFVFRYFRSGTEDDAACRFCRNICNHDATGYSRLAIVIKGVILYDRMPSRALGVTLSVELPVENRHDTYVSTRSKLSQSNSVQNGYPFPDSRPPMSRPNFLISEFPNLRTIFRHYLGVRSFCVMTARSIAAQIVRCPP